MKIFLILLFSIMLTTSTYADSFEKSTNLYFNHIENNPTKLYHFLLKMPKGADLHYHLDGGSYAENLFSYALNSGKCINIKSGMVGDCTTSLYIPFSKIKKNSDQYNDVIQDWSVIGNNIGKNNLKFYKYFPKTFQIRKNNRGEMLAEIVSRAHSENIMYLELMLNPDEDEIREFGMEQNGSARNFNQFENKLILNNIQKYVKNLTLYINSINNVKNKILKCDNSEKSAACFVKVKYIYQINRDVSLKAFFSSMLEGFMVASENKDFVGVSLVGDESGEFSTKNYLEEMKIIAFFHKKYPNVKITLHAGELSKNIAFDKPYIKSHVFNAVTIASPNRIGHGTDIRYEKNYRYILKMMKQKDISVETCLTSNDRLLGVSKYQSGILTYYKNQVPIMLCTDDEGILRTNLTRQFELAVQWYHFSYPDLKNIARNSIYYSFLPGKNLWKNNSYRSVNSACTLDFSKNKLLTIQCKNFISKNEKARMEWHLETQFSQFERSIKNT